MKRYVKSASYSLPEIENELKNAVDDFYEDDDPDAEVHIRQREDYYGVLITLEEPDPYYDEYDGLCDVIDQILSKYFKIIQPCRRTTQYIYRARVTNL